ncbi:conserved hypothetical protein [Paraburkholderia ribeironis]|uniref:Fe2OG dioxygenase domain-containing protein n=1 Tax=Paraburkholderia ribeironis TaxID=1247936 RepID=A0A1N7S8T3_9BURK|nr:hypothetical protein [Paraburkholderia ribeironis]SIT43752.1 conserved hypothetical protein [Paraburkholderia ribeironis]
MVINDDIHKAGKSIAERRNSANWAVELWDLITPKIYDPNVLQKMRDDFVRMGYVRFPALVTSRVLDSIKDELVELLQFAVRRNFEMPGYETPRNLSVLGGSIIKSYSPLLYSLYHHYALRSCVESVVGRAIFSCSHPEEFMVANFLHHDGDTHGWHLDDPAYALVIFLEIPGDDGGGDLEVIPNWTDLCHRKNRKPDDSITDLIAWATENGLVDRYRHEPGDAYLLRADMNLHRVAPLMRAGERRSVVNLAFDNVLNATRGRTADILYGGQHGVEQLL